MYGKPVPCRDICALMYAILSANSLRLIFRVHIAVAILRLCVDSYDLVSTLIWQACNAITSHCKTMVGIASVALDGAIFLVRWIPIQVGKVGVRFAMRSGENTASLLHVVAAVVHVVLCRLFFVDLDYVETVWNASLPACGRIQFWSIVGGCGNTNALCKYWNGLAHGRIGFWLILLARSLILMSSLCCGHFVISI